MKSNGMCARHPGLRGTRPIPGDDLLDIGLVKRNAHYLPHHAIAAGAVTVSSTLTDAGRGAVFLFDRGGVLRRSWAGSGHASDVARAVRQRR